MGFFDIFKKKKPATIPIIQEEKPQKKIYTEDQVKEEVKKLERQILQDVGNGVFTVTYEGDETLWKIIATSFIDKNEPILNSLFRDFVNSHGSDYYGSNVSLQYFDNGFMYYCKLAAIDHGITIPLTNWNIWRIVVSSDGATKVWLGDRYETTYSNKTTLADSAIKKAFAW